MSFFGKLRKLIHFGNLNQEIDEELRFHLEEKERQLIADGLSPAQARRQARKAFGSPLAVRENTRDAWVIRWVDDPWRDLRFAARSLRRSPGFTAVAVITLALGIGANATIFSFVNALLLRDLPVQSPEELVWFGVDNDEGRWIDSHSFRLYELLNEDKESFAGFAAVGSRSAGLTVGESTELIRANLVTENYFSLLGVKPALGRLLDPGDQAAGTRVAVLRFGFWQDHFGAHPAVIGRTVKINTQPFVVVGVAAREFLGSDVVGLPALWLPVSAAPAMGRSNYRSAGTNWMQIVGRISPSVSFEQAQVATAVAYQRFVDVRLLTASELQRERLQGRYSRQQVQLKRASAAGPGTRDTYVERLIPLAVAVGLVMLLCCANVANLLLGRGAQRRHEFVVRLAIGSSRLRLVRQLLIEGLVLVTIGGLIGAGIASMSWTHLQVAVVSTQTLDAKPDYAVFTFIAMLSVLSVLLFAVFPAVRASGIPLFSALRGSATALARNGSSLGSRGWLVAAQCALCLPLLVGAGLLIQTVSNLTSQDFGFERSQRLVALIAPSFSGYDEDGATTLFATLLSNLENQQGFSSVGFSIFGTMSRSRADLTVIGEGDDSRRIDTAATVVSEGYFQTVGVRLLAGRDVLPTDDAGSPRVMVVNESFARQWFEGENAIGQRVSDAEIVGVVADTKYFDLRKQPEPQIYQPYRQSSFGLPALYVYARTSMSLSDFASIIREQARLLDPTLVITQVRTLDAQVEESMQEERTVAGLLSMFGLLALIITAIVLYGVISFDVTRRTQEVGLRIALGARMADIHRMVFRRAASWIVGGSIAGLAAAAALTRLLESKLFGIGALDPKTFAAAAAFLLICAAVANYIPARRATRIEPMTALRHE